MPGVPPIDFVPLIYYLSGFTWSTAINDASHYASFCSSSINPSVTAFYSHLSFVLYVYRMITTNTTEKMPF